MPRPPLLPTLAAVVAVLACGRGQAPRPAAEPAPTAAPAAAQPAPVTARLVAPERVRHAPRVVVTGTLKARQAAALAMSVPGTLARVAVARGQEVRQGALLAALDEDLAAAALRQAEAGVQVATAQLAAADDALSRVERIRREDGVAEAQVVQVRSQRELAAAQLVAAEAQREQARVTLSHHRLVAPFAGVVTRVPDGIGVAVGAGVPLVTLVGTRRLVLETSLAQADAAALKPGTRVTVTVIGTGARTAEAVVAAVVPAVDPGTNRVPVEIDVPNADGRFLPSAFARAELPRGAERDAWRVPSASILQREGAHAVWVAGKEGRARTVPVRLLAEEGSTALVVPEEGDWPAELRALEAPPQGVAEGTPVVEVRG